MITKTRIALALVLTGLLAWWLLTPSYSVDKQPNQLSASVPEQGEIKRLVDAFAQNHALKGLTVVIADPDTLIYQQAIG